MSKNILPSILDAKPDNLEKLLSYFYYERIKNIHIDIMDGQYVPDFGLNERLIRWIKLNTDFYQDVHLMVNEPEKLINSFKNAGADGITIHQNVNDVYAIIEEMNDNQIDSGIAINPAEQPLSVADVLPLVHHVLVMTTCPGRSSHSFIPSMITKVQWLDNFRKSNNLHYRIRVDGGIIAQNISPFVLAGCDDFIVGGYITKAKNPKGRIEELYSKIC